MSGASECELLPLESGHQDVLAIQNEPYDRSPLVISGEAGETPRGDVSETMADGESDDMGRLPPHLSHCRSAPRPVTAMAQIRCQRTPGQVQAAKSGLRLRVILRSPDYLACRSPGPHPRLVA